MGKALKSEILKKARDIERERSWVREACALSIGQLRKPKAERLPAADVTRLDAKIQDAGQLRLQRADEIRALGEGAPERVAAILFDAATQLDNGSADVPRLLALAAAALNSNGARESGQPSSNDAKKIKPTPKTLGIIRLIEAGHKNDHINQVTRASVANIRKVRSVLKRGGYVL
jgi:hypothetical protein